MRRFALGLLLVAVSCVGCEDCELPPSCAHNGLGIIEGVITAAGNLFAGAVFIEPIGNEPATSDFTTLADSSGYYEIVLPHGEYRLAIREGIYGSRCYYAGDHFVRDRYEADTLRVGSDPQRIDFQGGAFGLDATIVGDWPSSRLRCELWERDPDRLVGVVGRSVEIVDQHASILFPLLLPGTYWIRIEASIDCVMWLPQTTDFEEADSVTVGTDAQVAYQATCGPLACIEGVIEGSWRSFPLSSRPGVQVYSAADSVLLCDLRTDYGGAYKAHLPVGIPAKLMVVIGGIGQWIGSATFENATTYPLAEGETVTADPHQGSGIVCTLKGPGLQSEHDTWFRLLDAEYNKVYEGGGIPHGGSITYYPNLRPGAYYLCVRRDRYDQPWCPQWFNQSEDLATATPIVIDEVGEIVEVTLQLQNGGGIHGQITRSGGRPLQSRRLVVQSVDGSFREDYAAYADPDDGTFEITGLANGAYFVGVPTWWDEVTWFPGTDDIAVADTVRIENHGIVESIDWQID